MPPPFHPPAQRCQGFFSIRRHGPQSSRLGQGELVLVESYEDPGLNFQSDCHMPQVKRTTWLRPGQPFSHRFGLPERFRPVQRFVNQCSVVQVFLNVAEYLAGVGLFDQAAISALPDGRPQLQAVKWRE